MVGRVEYSERPAVCTLTPALSKDEIVPRKEFCRPMNPATKADSGES